jgi:hypothetical protein
MMRLMMWIIATTCLFAFSMFSFYYGLNNTRENFLQIDACAGDNHVNALHPSDVKTELGNYLKNNMTKFVKI